MGQDLIEQTFVGQGEMAHLMRAHPWEHTSFGPVSDWPHSLRTAVSICLTSRFPMLMWWGPDLRLLYNDAWRPVLGGKHPALGRAGREVWPEIWHIIGPMLEGVLASGQATWQDDQLLMLERSGYLEEAYFTYSYSPIWLESGEVGGAFAAVSETTARVLAERRLQTLQDLGAQATLAKRADDACTMALRTVSANRADVPFALLYLLDASGRTLNLKGWSGMEAGLSGSPRSLPVDHRESVWPFAEVLSTGSAKEVSDVSQLNGSLPRGPWPVDVTQALLLPLQVSGQDRFAGVLVCGVNPCRVLDKDYRVFFDLLAGHIATAIANARAYEQERVRAESLLELDQAKTAFFSNVSHEFRTPLTLMLGPIEDMLNQTDSWSPARLRDHLNPVYRNSLRLLKLVNTLLDFSRIEAGRLEACYEPTDLAAFTADLASVFRSAIERAELTLLVHCRSLSSPVFVDRDMWEKIVLNLLSNSFKYTFKGHIAVGLQESNGFAELTVRDTGTGIPPHELPKIFTRFHRVKGAQGRTHEGSGIGLALVQELVRYHGGTITADSMMNEGTTMTVRIPLGSDHLPADRIRANRSSVSTATGATAYVQEALRWLPDAPAPEPIGDVLTENTGASVGSEAVMKGGGGRVLLAEDNADLRDYIGRLLRSRYRVEAVSDGQAALGSARRSPPDLILTDVMMPHLDGFGLLKALRAEETTRHIPVVMLSARAGEESRVEGMEAGADDYLVKPFSARELLARVAAHLELARLRREAADREHELRTEAEQAHLRIRGLLDEADRRNQELHDKQQQLIQTAKLASLGELTTGVAHELNNPLNNIGLFIGNAIERFQRHPVAGMERFGKDLHRVLQEVHKASVIVDHLRTFGRGATMAKERMSLNALMTSSLSLIAEQLRLKDIAVTLDLSPENPHVLGNAIQLEQVIINLLNNAKDAVKDAAAKQITVRTVVQKTTAEIIVKDSGVGMDEDMQSRIFDPFFTTKPVGKGTGLGLSITYGIIQDHNGTITVMSDRGKGASFRICLPLA